ncbi:MAG: hypothetical protein IBX50_11640 [Marinospirillum sp.]|uniref:hypothetical protein n=1 Tax=Marinospirillum sp. TaxID=2183934 RepID=UPI0019F08CBB|nr:hypothetical protein [Marinospirillum sp.]MBE0507350.1 hypothetical protein [Marinospirillum sp.]
MSSLHQPVFTFSLAATGWSYEEVNATRTAFENQLFPVQQGQRIHLRHINGSEGYLELSDIQEGLILLNKCDLEPPKYYEHHETLISSGWVLG